MRRISSTNDALNVDLDQPIRTGILLVVVGFFGFLIWAAFAPITSAAVAPGIVVADSHNKDIQHLEGGILHQMLVREGDRVRAGQILAILDGAAANANLGRLRAAHSAALAESARLIAERDGRDEISFPPELSQASDLETMEAVKSQQALFDTDRARLVSEQDISDQRISEYQEEIKGIQAQIASEDQQIALIGDELASQQTLFEKGLALKSQVLALRRTAADLKGQRGQHTAEIARAQQSIAEMQQQLVNSKAQHLTDVVSSLRDAQNKLADFGQQIVAASDTSRRLEVTAPAAGTVITILRGSPSSVIRPGETIMEILPEADQLIIEAHVRPEDIDSVAPGESARVRLTAYSQRRTSSLKGRVAEVSADHLVDAKTDKPYYLTRILVDAKSLAAQKAMKLYPGMPAVVFIESGRHSMLNYLLTPLFSGIERGLREQ